jgi:DNA-binding transcriptional MocR family regulator
MWVKQILAHPDLLPTTKNIGVAISVFMNADSREAWPSHRMLAEMCSVTERTSYRAIQELEAAGFLSISRKANCANRYEMRKPPLTGVSVPGRVRDTPPLTRMSPSPDSRVTYPLTRTSPEPLTEPSIEPFIEAPPPSSFGNDAVVASVDSKKEKGSGEVVRGKSPPPFGISQEVWDSIPNAPRPDGSFQRFPH